MPPVAAAAAAAAVVVVVVVDATLQRRLDLRRPLVDN